MLSRGSLKNLLLQVREIMIGLNNCCLTLEIGSITSAPATFCVVVGATAAMINCGVGEEGWISADIHSQ